MRNQGITDEDRYKACQRAHYTKKDFRQLLRRDLHQCLDGRKSVSIDEFVDYFNLMNVRRGHKPLNTWECKYPAYFEALEDVCTVNDEYTHLFPLPPNSVAAPRRDGPAAQRVAQSQPSSAGHSPSRNLPPKSSSAIANLRALVDHVRSTSRPRHRFPVKAIPNSVGPTPRRPQSEPPTADGGEVRKNITIVTMQQILVAFTHGISKRMISWQKYCEQLKDYDREAFDRFSELRPGESGIEFVKKQVSGVNNTIEFDPSNKTLTISECFCCKSCPQSPVARGVPSKEKDEEAFSFSLGLFRNVKLPMKDWLEAQVVEADHVPHRLRLRFVWRNQAFETLHEQLTLDYQNNGLIIEELTVGMVCAVPLEGTKDYHRGIVKNVSNPSLPVVFYVDLGIEQGVAKGCVRKLYEKYLNEPTFCLVGEVRNSPLYDERFRLANKLRLKKSVILSAEKYNSRNGRYVLLLDTDSGIMSDASRD